MARVELTIVGVRRDGEIAIEFAGWRGPHLPMPGSQVELSTGEHVRVVILPDQMLGARPDPVLQIVGFEDLVTNSPERGDSAEAARFDALVQSFPELGTMVPFDDVEGMVISRDLRHGTIAVRMLDSGEIVTVPIQKQG